MRVVQRSPQRPDRPPPERLRQGEHEERADDGGPRGGSPRANGLHRAGDEEEGVEHDHDRVVTRAHLDGAPRSQDAARSSVTAPARRGADRRRARAGPGRRGAGSPFEEHQLGAEAGSHREREARDRRGAAPPRSSRSREHEQHRRRGEIPDLVQRAPRARRARRPGSASASSNASSTLGPPVWAIQWRMSRRVSPCVAEEGVDVAAEVLPDDLGHLGREHDLEAGVDDVPAHDPLGVGVEDRARRDDARPRRRRVAAPASTTAAAPSPKSPEAMTLATERSSRCSVSEQSSTESSTADLAREGAQRVRGARQARPPRPRSRGRRSASASASLSEPEPVHEPRVDARASRCRSR